MADEQSKTEDGSKILSELVAECRYLHDELRSLRDRLLTLERAHTRALSEEGCANAQRDAKLARVARYLGWLQEIVVGYNMFK
jgi:hypothetical protein